MSKTIHSLEKALAVIDYLSYHPKSRIQDISETLNINKSTIHSILNTLELRHYVEKDESRPRYSLGVKNFQLGQVYNQNFTFHYPIHEVLQKLSEEANETAFFALQIGCKYLYLDKYECFKQLKISPQLGSFEEINSSTAVGKIFQSHIDKNPFCYSVDLEEVEKGMNCVAFGLYKKGILLGVIGVAGNSQQLTKEKIDHLIISWSKYEICTTNI